MEATTPLKRELVSKLRSIHNKVLDKKVVLLPDFYIDRLIYVRRSPEEFIKMITSYAETGGGIQNVLQEIVRGGNAANTAAVLASLGVPVYLITEVDELGYVFLRHFFKEFSNVCLDYVKLGDDVSKTTSFEIIGEKRSINIMFGYPGSLPKFCFKKLSSRDLKLLAEADMVGIFNWAGNYYCGTDLFLKLPKYVKENGRGLVYADIADPRSRLNDLPDLIYVLKYGYIDFLSLNEIELSCIASKLGLECNKLLKCAVDVYRELGVTIVLHTNMFSACIHGDAVIVPAFNVKPKRLTGAGDSFNSGFIFSTLADLNMRERLLLGNSVAGFYITWGMPKNMWEIVEFIENTPLKEIGGEFPEMGSR